MAFARRANVGGLRHRIVRSLILVDPSGASGAEKTSQAARASYLVMGRLTMRVT
jgi:hypothetical protein